MPFFPGVLGKNYGVTTCSIYRLDPLSFTTPVEPIIDLVPGVTPLRVTLDMIDGEQVQLDYDVTVHALQDPRDATTNVHKQLERLTISGTMIPQPQQAPVAAPFLIAPNPNGLIRLDQVRLANIQKIADAGLPVMVTTPRYTLSKALIESVSSNQANTDGELTLVTLSFVEARIVSPLTGEQLAPDYPSMVPGNNQTTNGGQQSTTQADTQTATVSPTTGVSPRLGPPA